MVDITLRGDKGSPLTHEEVDNNFSGLNTELERISTGPFTGTYQNLHPVVATITTAIDMNEPFMAITLAADTTFTATNLAEGKVAILKLKPSTYTPAWPSEINWGVQNEPDWGAFNTWVISLVCDSGTDILASATGHEV